MKRAAGTLVIAKDTDRVLLLQRADGGGWDQPGGHADPADGDAAENAVREFEEETGTGGADLDCIASFMLRRLPDGSIVGYVPRPPLRAELEYTVFVCTFPSEFAPRLSAEHTGWGWFDVAQPPLDLHPGTRVALQHMVARGY